MSRVNQVLKNPEKEEQNKLKESKMKEIILYIYKQKLMKLESEKQKQRRLITKNCFFKMINKIGQLVETLTKKKKKGGRNRSPILGMGKVLTLQTSNRYHRNNTMNNTIYINLTTLMKCTESLKNRNYYNLPINYWVI